MGSKYCVHCGKPDPESHTCYDVLERASSNLTDPQREAAAARLDLIDTQAKQIDAGYKAIAMMSGKLESMKDKIGTQAADIERLREVPKLIQLDPHQWSKRPCSTCSDVSQIIGKPFGCSVRAAQSAAQETKQDG